MNISANNVLYWLKDPLNAKEWWILRRLADGIQPRDRFHAALLIAIGCIAWDKDRRLHLTNKGREAIEFFRSEYYPCETT